jgi:predicted ferric reductase
VIALTSPYLWYTARATGIVALVLLTLTVALGTLVATRVGGNAVGRFELNEVHRSISMITMVFVAIHVVVTIIDSYVPIGYFALFVPFTSAYRRLPVAVGTISLDLLLAVMISSLLKERIRHSSWRFIHWFSWLSFAVAVLHGFLAGSDAHRLWSEIISVSCLAIVAASAVWRIAMRPERAAGRTAHSPVPTNRSRATSHAPRTRTHSSVTSAPARSSRTLNARTSTPPPAPPRNAPRGRP